MDQIKELQEQIEALKKTVNELQSGTVRVETNTAKLARMKDQIVKEVFPEKMFHINTTYGKVPQLDQSIRRCISPVVNELFEMKTDYEKVSGYTKMANYIFGHPDSENVLKEYLNIYRSVCEFICSQIDEHWEAYGKKMEAWIEQVLSFDFPEEVDAYLKELDNKGIQYSVIRREKLKLRIRKQYNKNTLLRKG